MGWQFPHDKEFTSSRNIFPRTYHHLRLSVTETSKTNHYLLSRTHTLFTTVIRSFQEKAVPRIFRHSHTKGF